jgi:hypothetical protein
MHSIGAEADRLPVRSEPNSTGSARAFNVLRYWAFTSEDMNRPDWIAS